MSLSRDIAEAQDGESTLPNPTELEISIENTDADLEFPRWGISIQGIFIFIGMNCNKTLSLFPSTFRSAHIRYHFN